MQEKIRKLSETWNLGGHINLLKQSHQIFLCKYFCSVATGNQTNEENADQEFTDQNLKTQ